MSWRSSSFLGGTMGTTGLSYIKKEFGASTDKKVPESQKIILGVFGKLRSVPEALLKASETLGEEMKRD